jgi:IclR family acetate operon transcriptional repressor
VLAAPLVAVTDLTLADPRALRADLKRTRARGYASEEGEFRAGVRALAAPVSSAGGEIVGALALSTRNERPTPAAHRAAVIAAAALSSRLAADA